MSKYFFIFWKWVWEWFFFGVDLDVIDEFVFCFERFEFLCIFLLIICVIGLFWIVDMIYSNVVYNFMYCVKYFVVWFFGV